MNENNCPRCDEKLNGYSVLTDDSKFWRRFCSARAVAIYEKGCGYHIDQPNLGYPNNQELCEEKNSI